MKKLAVVSAWLLWAGSPAVAIVGGGGAAAEPGVDRTDPATQEALEMLRGIESRHGLKRWCSTLRMGGYTCELKETAFTYVSQAPNTPTHTVEFPDPRNEQSIGIVSAASVAEILPLFRAISGLSPAQVRQLKDAQDAFRTDAFELGRDYGFNAHHGSPLRGGRELVGLSAANCALDGDVFVVGLGETYVPPMSLNGFSSGVRSWGYRRGDLLRAIASDEAARARLTDFAADVSRNPGKYSAGCQMGSLINSGARDWRRIEQNLRALPR